MRLLVFGGRTFSNINLMCNAMNEFYMCHGPITFIIHGCAAGADSMAQHVAQNWLMVPESGNQFKPDWKNINVPGAIVKYNSHGPYNANAGFNRNEQMLTVGKPDWGMMFPGGNGTKDMCERLEKAGVPVWKVKQ